MLLNFWNAVGNPIEEKSEKSTIFPSHKRTHAKIPIEEERGKSPDVKSRFPGSGCFQKNEKYIE